MSDDKKDTKKTRLLGLDVMRGLAVFLMIEQHLGVWLWHGPDPGKTPFDYPILITFNALGGGAAPLFTTLAGIGSALLCSKRDNPDSTILRRGIVLMGFGYLLSLLTPSWFTLASWFVLHLMGFGMILVPLIRRLPRPAILGSAAALLALTPVLQIWLQTPDKLKNLRMAGWVAQRGGEVLPWAPLRIAMVEGHFPVFPWLAFFLFGFVAGLWIAEDRRRNIPLLGLANLAIGGAMAGLYYGKVGFAQEMPRVFSIPIPFYPTTPTFILVLSGAILLVVSAMLAIEQRITLKPTNPAVTLGRASLTLLLLHVVIFRELTRPEKLIWPTYLHGKWQSMPPNEALSVLLIFTALCIVGAWFWQKVGYKYGAEWILRQAAP